MDACVERESGEWLVASDEFRKEQDGGNCSTAEEDAEECAPCHSEGDLCPRNLLFLVVLQEADPSLRSG